MISGAMGALVAGAAVLLVVAGVAKLRTPAPAAAMLRGFAPRLRGHGYARAAGVVEIAAGTVALVWGNSIALAVCYLALLIVAIRLVRKPQGAACGCFGAADGEVGAAHIVLDAVCLAIAVAGVAVSPRSALDLVGDGTLTSYTVVAQAFLAAALGYLSITALPALSSARRSVEAAR